MGDIKVGDTVRITSYRSYSTTYVGLVGTVVQIDDDGIPYLLSVPSEGELWAEKVERVSGPTSSTRDELVTRARGLLIDTNYTAADLIRMAEFLAGE